MLNDLFKKYQNLAFKEVDIDAHHKKQLQKRLFKEEKTRTPFWTWTKTIFTAPVVAAIALVFLLSSNQETVKQVLKPQEALAQALENTFNLDSFETTFGLPDDGKFYHRVMTYHTNDTENHYGPYTEKTDLWTDGEKLRKDTLLWSDADPSIREFRSFLVNPVEDVNCSFVLFKECDPFSLFYQDQINDFLDGISIYKPVDSENLISDVSIKPFYEGPKQPLYLLEWSTKSPMEFAEIASGHDYMAAAVGLIDDPAIVSNPNEYNFVNVFKEDKYWHGTPIALETSFIANKQYFQIKNHVTPHKWDPRLIENKKIPTFSEEISMIYVIDRKGNVSPLSPHDFVEDIKHYNVSTDAAKDLFHMGFQSAIFHLQQEGYSDPIDIQPLEKDGEKMTKFRYLLPKDYFKFSPDLPQEDHFVDLYIDETQKKFLGYAMVKDEVELESLWIKDEVLPDTDKPQIFDQAEWEKSIADEYEAKAKERKEWFDAAEKQIESGEVEIKHLN